MRQTLQLRQAPTAFEYVVEGDHEDYSADQIEKMFEEFAVDHPLATYEVSHLYDCPTRGVVAVINFYVDVSNDMYAKTGIRRIWWESFYIEIPVKNNAILKTEAQIQST